MSALSLAFVGLPPASCGHEYLLSERHRTASLQVQGGTAQARRLWSRLERGAPVSIGVLGASVAMSGGCQREHQPHVRCADFDGRSYEKRWSYGGRTKGLVRGFVMQVLDWINTTWPHPAHRVYNGASDGNPAAVLERCMLSALPSDVDIVLLEFGSARSDPYSVERIIRRLLRLPSRPVLVLVNVREWCRCGALLNGRKPQSSDTANVTSQQPRRCSASGHDVRAVTRMFSRWEGPEDDFALLCRHYSQTCVSLRDGIFSDVMRGAPGFSVMEVAADCVHPSRGTKGHRYLGDVVVHALESSWRSYHGRNALQEAAVVELLPPPLHVVNRECQSDSQPAWRCYSFEVNPTSRLQNDRVLTGRFEPDPSEPGGAPPAAACAALADCVLRSQARTTCLRTLGHWQYCPRAFNAARARKPGLVAFRAGASMRVHVDARVLGSDAALPLVAVRQTSAGDSRDEHPTGDPCSVNDGQSQVSSERSPCALVSVAHLTSYEQMGIARVTCEGGCACAPYTIDAHVIDPTRNVSIVREAVFRVTAASECVLRFTLSDVSSSGGHKWKLLRIAVGATPPTVTSPSGSVSATTTTSSSCAERQPHYRGWINMRTKRRGVADHVSRYEQV